ADAARRLLGLDPLPAQPPFFWSDQFGLRLQLVGDPACAASVALEGDESTFVARFHKPDGRLVAALAANRSDAVGELRRELALAA
ncbi:MAG: oxidoreductase C-terminal domain-containing protein, partial [Gaiellaceae bacterium]